MSKIFHEGAWEDDLPCVETSFNFSDKIKTKKLKEKKTKDTPENGHARKKPMGWSVLLSHNNKSEPYSTAAKNPDARNIDGSQQCGTAKGRKRKATQDGYHQSDTTSQLEKNEAKISTKKRKSNDYGNTNGDKEEKAGFVATQNGANHSRNIAQKQMKTKSKDMGKSAKQEGNLRDKLVERLKGSRFRFINEQLYKTTGEEAKKLFRDDPESFAAYHEGYRHQVAQWSMNPLDRIIKSICKLPKNTVVADFGCGEARLAESIPNQTYSLDLVSHNSSVIACDMANTPLESNFVNVVVFCLSLMGTNLVDFFLEANRVLKVGGLLKIAEVSSRFDNEKEFVASVTKCGFKLINKDLKHKLFYFFTFKKERTIIKGSTKIQSFSLKPCLYKKR